MKGKDIIVWFSCGAASAVAAKLTIEEYGKENNVRVVNNPVKEEHEDNTRFLKDVEKWLGVNIEICTNPKYENASAVEVWEDRKFMAGIHGAPCTLELKKFARQYFESNNKVDYHVLGFTVDEENRAKRFKLTERENVLDVLIDKGLTKQDCMDLLVREGIEPPYVYRLGYPNANCVGCVKATSPTYWNLVRTTFPEVFEERAKQSRELGVRLVRVNG
jgi:peroxiredoxin